MKISVIIPFYNLERYARECLDSVGAAVEKLNSIVDLDLQPRPLLEVICVDDGSTDGTGALLDEFAGEFKAGVAKSVDAIVPIASERKKLSFPDAFGTNASTENGGFSATSSTSTTNFNFTIIHQPNGGEGAARNAGMAAATGDWITFLDGDDVWLGNHLVVAVPVLARHPDADLVSFRFAPFEDGAPVPEVTELGDLLDAAGTPRLRVNDGQARRRGVPAASLSELDLRKTIPDEAILDIGVYPTFYRREFLRDASFSKLPLGADRLFVAQCLARANTVVMGATVIHGYRLRANSMAHCAWSARKVISQCNYAFGSLLALAASGKALGREGQSYLASLWLSDVPNRLLRLKTDERDEVAAHWIATLEDERVVKALPRFERVRRILRACARVSPSFAVRFARILRKGGVT